MKNKTKRWAHPIEFEQHSLGLSLEQLARILQRTPRTVRDWQLGNRPIPAWAPELLRLRHAEGNQYRRQLEAMKVTAREYATSSRSAAAENPARDPRSQFAGKFAQTVDRHGT